MPIFERPFNSINELHETELEHLRLMFETGSQIAVQAAAHYCRKHHLNLPAWLESAVTNMTLGLPNDTSPNKGGRSNAAIPRYLQDLIDHKRWSAVEEVFEYRRHLQREIDTLRGLRGLEASKLRKQLEAKLRDLGRDNLANAFASASTMLEGTRAACQDDAIEKSYEKVQRANREMESSGGPTSMRYHIVDSDFLRIARERHRKKKKSR